MSRQRSKIICKLCNPRMKDIEGAKYGIVASICKTRVDFFSISLEYTSRGKLWKSDLQDHDMVIDQKIVELRGSHVGELCEVGTCQYCS